MKKFLLTLIACAALFSVNAQGLFLEDKKVNFTFPESITTNKTMLFPTFQVQSPDDNDTLAITISELETYVRPDTLSGNTLLTLSIASWVTAGAKLYLELVTDTVRTITHGTGFLGADISTADTKRQTETFIYNGTKFTKFGGTVTLD